MQGRLSYGGLGEQSPALCIVGVEALRDGHFNFIFN